MPLLKNLLLKKNSLRKFLIIRFSSIGDIVLTTPVIRCLKKQLPESEIHYLTKSQFLPVLEDNPHIDKIFTIRENIGEVLPDLKNQEYEMIIDLHKNFRSKGTIINLRRPARGFDKINFQKWLMVNFKINRLPPVHIVDRYFQAVESLGVMNDGLGLAYFIPEKDEVNVKNLPGSIKDGYIAWVIGGKHKTKIYPEDLIIETIKNSPRTFVLLGGPEDAEKGNRIEKATGNRVFNACGKFNINQSASLVKQALKVITNDTGLMHIAAAFKKEIISLWGNTIPEFGMYPYMPSSEANSILMQVNGLSCRPCSKLGFKECPKGHFKCMREIRPEAILSKI